MYTFFNDQFKTSKKANKRVHAYLFWAEYAIWKIPIHKHTGIYWQKRWAQALMAKFIAVFKQINTKKIIHIHYMNQNKRHLNCNFKTQLYKRGCKLYFRSASLVSFHIKMFKINRNVCKFVLIHHDYTRFSVNYK